MIVLNGEWEQEIKDAWESCDSFSDLYDENRCEFLAQIWHQSMVAFDTPREIQVVIDNEKNLHISFGSASFVSFDEEPTGLKLPIKCWIHTHPFGQAYFSGTDKKTIDTWRPMMRTAIVLGDNEHQVWFKEAYATNKDGVKDDMIVHYQYKVKTVRKYISLNEMTIVSRREEE
tara:strand:+ start:482 stop:1000 length:519 start_codon:yes stop_codon:yes gene_type:complete